MSAASILAILQIVNGLIAVANGAPSVLEHARALLNVVRPFVQEAGVEVATAFAQAEQRL